MTLLPSLPGLRAFATVARRGSFAAAAAELNVTASAVSHQIRLLEEQLCTPLLHRARNGSGHSRTEPTQAGLRLLDTAESILARLAETCEAIREHALGRRARLVVSANGSFASLWLAPRLASFAALHPSVSWHMRATEEEAPDMDAAGIHLAVLRARPDQVVPPDRLLFEETVFPVCSPALGFAGRPEALLEHNLLEEEHRAASPEKGWRHWLQMLGQPPGKARIVGFSSYNQVVGAAVAGAGIALARSPLIDADLASGRLLRLFAPIQMGCALAFTLRTLHTAQADPHIRQLRDFLLASAARDIGPGASQGRAGQPRHPRGG